MVEIENFMKTIIEIVYNANPQIKKDVLKQDKQKWKDENEAKKGVMALWSQSIEKIIQEECITYLINKNIPEMLSNELIKKSLYFTRNIIQKRFFIPNNLLFPKSRIILENYFN